MKKTIIATLVIVNVVVIAAIIIGMVIIPNIVVDDEYIPVTAVVTDKDYTPTRTINVVHKVGKTTVVQPQVTPADYDIVLQYDDIVTRIDTKKDFFESIEIGDKMNVYLYYGYNRSGEITKTCLKLEAK